MRSIKRGLFFIGVSVLFLAISIGRSAASLSLTSSLTASEHYNDNFFFSDEGKQGEVTTIIAPSIGLTYDERDMVLSTQYQGGVEVYLRNRSESRYTHGFSFGLDFPVLSRLVKGMQVKVTETVTYTPQPVPFSFENKPGEGNEGIQVPRTDRFQNRAGVAVSYSWSPRFATTLSYGYLVTRYKGDRLQDSAVHDAGLDGAYQISRRTTWSMGYAASVADYSNAEDILSHRVSMGAGHQISPTLSWSGRVGLATIPGESTQMTLEASISKSSNWWSGSLQYGQGLGTGGGVTSSLTLSQRLTGQVTWVVAKETSAYMQLAYGENTALPRRGLKISTYEAGTGLRITFFSWLNGSLAYSYLSQEAQGTGGIEGERNLVMFTLTAMPLPWRLMK